MVSTQALKNLLLLLLLLRLLRRLFAGGEPSRRRRRSKDPPRVVAGPSGVRHDRARGVEIATGATTDKIRQIWAVHLQAIRRIGRMVAAVVFDLDGVIVDTE